MFSFEMNGALLNWFIQLCVILVINNTLSLGSIEFSVKIESGTTRMEIANSQSSWEENLTRDFFKQSNSSTKLGYKYCTHSFLFFPPPDFAFGEWRFRLLSRLRLQENCLNGPHRLRIGGVVATIYLL